MSTTTSDFLRHLRTLAARQASSGLTDQQLLERFRLERSEASFALLVQRHGPMVLNVCRRILHHVQDAEDAFQATFLVLAKKAAALRQPPLLSGWLYSVAYHVAMRQKAKGLRRVDHERRADPLPTGDAMDDITWRELRVVLDEELQRLPERYRAPLVLCYLEARTQDEAARQLGWSKNTFTRRINQARQLLARRLTRRGLTLPAVLTAPLLIDSAAQAALPPLLTANTIRAGLAVAMGNTAGGVVSAQVLALAGDGLGSLLAKKASIALVVFVSLMVGAGGLLAHRAVQESTRADAPPPPARSASKGQAIDITGRVLGPDGKPFAAGATVYFVPKTAHKKADLKARAATDKEGTFRLRIAPADMQSGAWLLATAPGHGPDWTDVKANGETCLRLVKDDVPIRGRVIDLEGQPIAGVTVEAARLARPVEGDLTPWLNVQTKKDQYWRHAEMNYLWPPLLDATHTAKTDADGRFRMSGFGRERLVILNVSGPTIATYSYVPVLTRSGPAAGWAAAHHRIYAASFDFAAGPSKPITGTVRDKATGKPLAGIQVWEGYIKLPLGEIAAGDARTITDEKGRYRLMGIGKRKEYAIAAEGGSFFHVTKENIADTPGLEPITVDFELTRGIPIRGRLTDKATGKPVRGDMSYLARADNPHLKDYQDFSREGTLHPHAETGEDGSFAVLAIPGPGLLCVGAKEADRYIGFEWKDWDGFLLRAVPGGLHPSGFNAVIPIEVSTKDAKSTNVDITLEPGRTRTGTVVGPDGKPLAGAHVAGLAPVPHWLSLDPRRPAPSKGLPAAAFSALGLNPRKARNLVFFHPDKKLGKVQAVHGDESGPLTVRLEPLGGVRGRILDANGRPWAGLTVRASLTRLITAYKDLPWELLENLGPTMEVKTTTDGEGRFRIDGLLSGLRYNLAFGVGAIKPGAPIAAHREDLTVESGKVKDIGDVKSEDIPQKEAKPTEPRP